MANVLGFAIAGIYASVTFPLMFVAALFLGVIGLLLFSWMPGPLIILAWIPPGAVVGCLTGLILGGFAGVAQADVLKAKAQDMDMWARRSLKGSLIGGALAGGLAILLLQMSLPVDAGHFANPLDSDPMGGSSFVAFFPVNWLFRISLDVVLVLGMAGAITGFFVGRSQGERAGLGTDFMVRWPYWSAIGWGLGWGIAALLTEPMLEAVGLGPITAPDVNVFENWPMQLAAAAISLALCGLVYALATFRPLITHLEEM